MTVIHENLDEITDLYIRRGDLKSGRPFTCISYAICNISDRTCNIYFHKVLWASCNKREELGKAKCLGISRNIFQRVIYFGIIFSATFRNAAIQIAGIYTRCV